MAVPRLPVFDAKAFVAPLARAVRKPDGSPYAAFDRLPDFVAGLRGLRDNVASLDVFTRDVKGDVDSLRGMSDRRLDSLEQRMAVLEAQPQRPFPDSG